MTTPLLRFVAFVLCLLCSTSARAADYWVDAVNGSNTNGGTGPGDAWLTLTHALATAGLPGTVHVLPGTYDATLGEVFPLILRSSFSIQGEGGRDVTIVESGVDAFQTPSGGTYLLSGLTVRATGNGIRASSFSSVLTVRCTDMRFEGCLNGIDFLVGNWTCFGYGNELRLERVELLGNAQNGVLVSGSNCSDNHVFLDDCLARGNGVNGLLVSAPSSNDEIYFYPEVRRSRFIDNGVHGFHVAPAAVDVTVIVEDSLFAGNRVGLARDCSGSLGTYPCRVLRCTFADNTDVGYRINNLSGHDVLFESVLYGNGDDLLRTGGANPQAASNNIGDGDYQGVNGNISVDPLFVNPVRDDYRLGFGTPCVDAITGAGPPDLDGNPRGNDGNLDLAGARDMGALELRTLSAPETARIGRRFEVTLFGPPGHWSALRLDRMGLLANPTPTPFGLMYLNPLSQELAATRKFLGPGPVPVKIDVPNVSALVGLRIGFQALTRSPLAPAGAAYSDADEVEIVP